MAKPKGVETIFLGNLNARLGDPRNKRKEDLAMGLSNHDLEDFTRHFTSHQRYREQSQRTWQMQNEVRQVTGRGDYVLGTAQG